jgi:undecaprenyl-diphosphatase
MSRPAASTVVLSLAGVAVVAGLAALVLTGMSREFDRAVIDVLRAPGLVAPFSPLRTITELGSTCAVIVLAGLALLVGILIGPWRHGLIAAVVVGLASLGNSIIKGVIARARPDLLAPLVTESGYSFPSGHAALGMVGWGILAVLISRTRLPRAVRAGIVAGIAVLVFLIGVSRVYLGVHYPTDVIAGWTLGGIVVLLYERLTRGVSTEPAAAAVDADPAARRSDPPAPG